MEVEEVTSTVVASEQGADRDTRQLNTVDENEFDEKQHEWYPGPGIDSNPPAGTRVVTADAGPSWTIAITGQDPIVPEVGEGEIRIYSQADGAVQAEVRLLADGTIKITGPTVIVEADSIEVGGNGDNAVNYSGFAEIIDELKQLWDNFANAYAPGGPSAVGTPPKLTATTVSTDTAKNDKVLL